MVEPKDEEIKKVIELGTGIVTPQERALHEALGAVKPGKEGGKKEEPKKKPSFLSKFIGKTGTKVCPEHGDVGWVEGDTCPRPGCGKHLTMKRGPLGNIISFGSYFGIIFGSLVWVFGAFLSFLNKAIGQYISPYLVVGLISAGAAYGLAGKTLGKGIAYSIILVSILGIAFPFVTGIFGGEGPSVGGVDIMCYFDKLRTGDYQGLELCYTSVQKKKTPTYTKTSYESLEINLGAKREEGYEISTIFATESYSLDIFLLNKNPEGSGIKIHNIILGAKAIKNDNSSDYYVGFIDVCNETIPCTLNPTDEKRVDADFSYIDCKDGSNRRSLKTLTFSVNSTYEQDVTHSKTLGVAASYEDMKIFKTDADLKKEIYETEPPSAGPVDLIIDFSPYYLGERPDEEIEMSVFVINKGRGKLRPGDITIEAIAPTNEIPEWLKFIGGKRCKQEGNKIILESFATSFFKLTKPYEYSCDFQIDKTKYPTSDGEPESFQTVKFKGLLTYEYLETVSSEAQIVDRRDC